MKIIEYKNLVESLYIGHEFSFSYNNKTYFLERTNEGCELYDISDSGLKSNTGNIICKINNKDLIFSINEFLEEKIFDGLSFNEIYVKVKIIDIE